MSDAKPELVHLTIDGKELDVPAGTLVIRAAESLGITIPRFCDHPLLDPIGACRQCMVEVEGQRKPFTACTTRCTEGMVVRTHHTSEVAELAQRGQLEFLLINHPLDCPQCDKGGECPLQDQTLAHGPPDSRFIDRKRVYEKPIPISPLVALDRERCVLCARCTRFSQQISGDPFIELFERGALEQVAIYEDEPYHSYFSGNVVQICPVGALTSTSYRFRSRPFDLRSLPGVCNHCSAGCNLRVDVRNGQVQRQLARDNMAVNEMWNCDKGRYGYEYVAHPDRLREPAARDDLGGVVPVPWLSALRDAGRRLAAAVDAGGPEGVGVITGGRLTDEDAYALSRFARDVLGTDNVDFRLRPRTLEERDVLAAVSGTVGPTYDEVGRAPVVVVAGLDPEEEVPILHLRLRKAWRDRGQRIVVVGPVLGSLAEIAWRWVRTTAGDEARVLAALAQSLERPSADDPRARLAEDPAVGADTVSGLDDLIGALGEVGAAGGPPGIVLAGERLALSPGALPAAADLARSTGMGFAWVPRRNGARGALDAGLVPGLLPGGRRLDHPGPVADAWRRLPQRPGLDTRGMLEAAAAGRLSALYLIGVDLARDFEDPRLARAALQRADSVIVQDLLPSDTTRLADVVLPAAAAQERVGSFTTWEGRRQPFAQAVPLAGVAQEDWDILRQLARVMGRDLGWETAMDVRDEAAPLMSAGAGALERMPAPVRGAATDAPLGAGGAYRDPRRAVADEPARLAGGEEEHPLDVVVLDYLLGDGAMLRGAAELRRSARRPSVWLHPDDARRFGIRDGLPTAVIGPGGRYELPARVTDAVTVGCVVLPGASSHRPPGELAEPGVPPGTRLQVRLEPLAAAGAAPGRADHGEGSV